MPSIGILALRRISLGRLGVPVVGLRMFSLVGSMLPSVLTLLMRSKWCSVGFVCLIVMLLPSFVEAIARMPDTHHMLVSRFSAPFATVAPARVSTCGFIARLQVLVGSRRELLSVSLAGRRVLMRTKRPILLF